MSEANVRPTECRHQEVTETPQAFACILCGGLPSHFLCCPDFLTAGGRFSLVRCTRCGFLWTADAPEAGDIHRFYGALYERSIHPPFAHPLLRRMWMEIQTRGYAGIVERHAQKQCGDVLDIGCGDGDFLRTMRKRGWNVTGVELTDETRKKLKGIGIQAIGPEEWPNIPNASFDAVTLWHALEHLHKPDDVLKRVRCLLKPEGVCFIVVPNAASPQAQRDGSLWFGYDAPRHLWHFTPATLERLLIQTGFVIRTWKPLRIDGFTITLLMMYIQRRKDWPRALLESGLMDVLLARKAHDASCMMCIASPSVYV